MGVTYHIEKMNELLQHISVVLKMGIQVYDANGNVLSTICNPDDYCSRLQKLPNVRSLCKQCDHLLVKKCQKSHTAEKHLCHAGLYDFIIPVFKNDVPIAYVEFGRIRTALSPEKPRYPEAGQHANEQFYHTPLFSEAELSHLSALLPSIILDSTITITYDTFQDDIIPYITEHIDQELSVPSLCRRYHLSKNTLYRFFQKEYGCSVGEYIARIRLARAEELLLNTALPITQLAQQAGFRDYAYFCRFFKQRTNCTPTAYRNKKTDEL